MTGHACYAVFHAAYTAHLTITTLFEQKLWPILLTIYSPSFQDQGSTPFMTISAGIGTEDIQVAGSPPTKYNSVEHYLQFMSHPFAYATNIELVAATRMYGLEFRITYHGQPYPDPPLQNVCDVLYYPSSFHYATLRFATSRVYLIFRPSVNIFRFTLHST